MSCLSTNTIIESSGVCASSSPCRCASITCCSEKTVGLDSVSSSICCTTGKYQGDKSACKCDDSTKKTCSTNCETKEACFKSLKSCKPSESSVCKSSNCKTTNNGSSGCKTSNPEPSKCDTTNSCCDTKSKLVKKECVCGDSPTGYCQCDDKKESTCCCCSDKKCTKSKKVCSTDTCASPPDEFKCEEKIVAKCCNSEGLCKAALSKCEVEKSCAQKSCPDKDSCNTGCKDKSSTTKPCCDKKCC